MPFYNYICDCGHTWEEYKSISDRNVPLSEPCPKCLEKAVKRQLTISNYLDECVINGDKNIEKSGVLKELERIKEHHPQMIWKG